MLIKTHYDRLLNNVLSEQYRFVKKVLSESDERFIIPISLKFAEPLPENVFVFPSIHEQLTFTAFVNKNIILELPDIDYKTLKVRLRIAASLLNKINSIFWTHDVKVQMFNNLCRNIEKEQMALYAEDLPF